MMRDANIMTIFIVLTLILDMVCVAIIIAAHTEPKKFKLYWRMMRINLILTILSVIYLGYCLWPGMVTFIGDMFFL